MRYSIFCHYDFCLQFQFPEINNLFDDIYLQTLFNNFESKFYLLISQKTHKSDSLHEQQVSSFPKTISFTRYKFESTTNKGFHLLFEYN